MGSETQKALTVTDLVVNFAQVCAVNEVTLTANYGEIVALLGPSGSGKSSLLRAVAGLERVASGKIEWEGVDVAQVPVHRRGFGLMFQEGQLFGHRNVGANVAYGLRGVLPKSQWETRVQELLDLVGLPDFAARGVDTLSGGQAQRVALARALAPTPQLLLLDEPLSALDRDLRERLVKELRSILTKLKMTSLYVTHDQDEAFVVADKVAIMMAGKLVRFGSPKQVWGDPGSRAVAQFLGYRTFLKPDEAAVFGRHINAGEALACAEDAFKVCRPDELAQWADNPGALNAPSLKARVEAVWGRRGGTEAELKLASGSVVRAHMSASATVGEVVSLVLDQAKTTPVSS